MYICYIDESGCTGELPDIKHIHVDIVGEYLIIHDSQ